jgi:streptogramin lyase
VHAVDAQHDSVVIINARTRKVFRDADVDLSPAGVGPLSVRVSPDGRVLLIGGTAGVVALDTTSMEPVTAASIPDGVTGLAYADDGSLFVSWDGGIGRLDPATLQTREVLPTPASGVLETAEAVAA